MKLKSRIVKVKRILQRSLIKMYHLNWYRRCRTRMNINSILLHDLELPDWVISYLYYIQILQDLVSKILPPVSRDHEGRSELRLSGSVCSSGNCPGQWTTRGWGLQKMTKLIETRNLKFCVHDRNFLRLRMSFVARTDPMHLRKNWRCSNCRRTPY